MSDTSKESKKPKKSVLPPQSSAQDTSNWEDRNISIPQAKKRKRRDFVMIPHQRLPGSRVPLSSLTKAERELVKQAIKEGKTEITLPPRT